VILHDIQRFRQFALPTAVATARVLAGLPTARTHSLSACSPSRQTVTPSSISASSVIGAKLNEGRLAERRGHWRVGRRANVKWPPERSGVDSG
jgi:hypothetical protein